MTLPIIIAAALVITYLAYRVLFGTDIPKIKGIPEIPGQPLFGSLLELGNNHAKVAKGWAEKYGPVFQVRLGNKVCNKQTHLLGSQNKSAYTLFSVLSLQTALTP
jgi:phenylacetate 2-hydroxylase